MTYQEDRNICEMMNDCYEENKNYIYNINK